MKGNFHPLVRALRRGTPSLASLGLLLPFAALANPSGADVVHGNVGISTPTPGGTVIDQTSDTAVINWQQFSIGDGEYVLFNQPSASAAVLNRVLGGNPSEILGNLSANGRVFLINPQGVMFGAGSRVDVGSLVVSTHDIADGDFLDGRYVFAGTSTADIRNDGTISASDGGFVVLAADQVTNAGLIQARLGEVVLASGSGVRFELDTGGLVNFQIDAAAASAAAGVDNLGDIVAEGGKLLMSAHVARDLASTAVNNSGRVIATAVEEQDGAIYLVAAGGNIDNSGLLDVSGGERGTVRLQGDADITLHDGSEIRAQGDNGGQVWAIADGALLHAQGSTIDVTAADGNGSGGFVDLSGHGSLQVRGDVVLGSNGHLLLDPTVLTVGDNEDDTISFAQLENLLKNNAGSRVELVASHTIQIREREGAQTLNGRNENGQGAGLLLGIGYYSYGGSSLSTDFVSFSSSSSGGSTFHRGDGGYIYIGENGSDDTLDIAGDIELITGYDWEAEGDGQVVAHAALRAGGSVYITASDSIVTRSITAGVAPQPTGSAGENGTTWVQDGVVLTPVFSQNSGEIQVFSEYGSINTGALKGEYVSLETGYGDINVKGAIDATGYAGIYSGRSIHVEGAILSEGAITLDVRGDEAFAGIRVDGAITARGNVGLYADTGDIDLTSVTLTEDPQSLYGATRLEISAEAGAVDVSGNLTATSATGRTELWVDGATGVRIGGDVLAQGYQQTSIGQDAFQISSFGGDAVDLWIESDGGDVVIDGVLRAHGLSAETEGYTGNGYYTTNAGDAYVSVYGRDVTLGGLDVSAVGDANVWVRAEEGNLRLEGPATVRAEAAQSDYTESYDGYTTTETARTGIGQLSLEAENGEISTKGVTVTGSLAAFGAHGETIRIGSGSDGQAVTVTAAGDAGTESEFRWVDSFSQNPDVVSTTDYGLAFIALSASGGDDSTPGIAVDGDLSVTGPSALALMLTDGRVIVDGDLDVNATGYTFTGDAHRLDDQVRIDEIEAFWGFKVPRLDAGMTHWGEAGISIVGYFPLFIGYDELPTEMSVGGDVLITGDITLTGIGEARMQVFGSSLEAGNIDVTAALGEISGVEVRWDDESGESSTTRIIGSEVNGEGQVSGVARYSSAEFEFKGDGSEDGYVEAGTVTLRGGTAAFDVGNVDSLELGGLELYGGRGENTPVYAENVDGIWTRTVGGLTAVDLDLGPSGSIDIAGPLKVEGTGLAMLLLQAGHLQLGAVSVAADRGEYANTNPDHAPGTIGFGDATVYLNNYSQNRVTLASLSASAADDLHLGTFIDASGNVLIEAGGSFDNTLSGAQRAFVNPRSFEVYAPSQDVVLPAIDIEAEDITLSFTELPDLDSLSLNARETLAFDGNGSTLSLDTLLELSSASISIIDIVINTASLNLTATNNLSIIDSTLNYGSGTFAAGGTILVDNSSLYGATHGFDAGTAITIRNNSLVTNDEGPATSIALAAPTVSVLQSTLRAGTIGLTAEGAGGLLLQGATLNAGTALTLNSAGTLGIDNSLLTAQTLTADATGALTVSHSAVNYNAGTFEGTQITVDDDSVLSGATHTLTGTTGIRIDDSIVDGVEGSANAITLSAPLIEVLNGASLDGNALNLSGNALSVQNSTLSGTLLASFFDSISLSGATLNGDSATLTQSGTEGDDGDGISIANSTLGYAQALTVDAAGPLTLSGSIDTAQLRLESGAALTVHPEQALLIEAGAIDAIAEMIDLEGSTLAIGTGAAVNGIDTALFNQVPTNLRPVSTGPNASFVATSPTGEVRLGTITLEGGYLFVRAVSASAEELGAPGRLLYNYRPFDDNADVLIPTEAGLNITAPAATLAIGGTGYAGDITVQQPQPPSTAMAKATETFDYVFLTGGTIFNPSTLNTSGEVVIVGGTVVNPQEPASPSSEAEGAQNIVSELADNLPLADDNVPIDVALIEEESSSAAIIEEFQCR